MSTFAGTFEEIPFISADRFDKENLSSKVFFLSHCHMDHMQGLGNSNGLPGPLYTSAASKVFVRSQFPKVKDIRVLEIDSPQDIKYEANGTEYQVFVTALPARHCPGSVMFLFQSHEYTVLYTGDFRLTKDDLQTNFSSLQHIKPDVLYLDSTFLNKDYINFPTQSESISKICDLISNWLARNKQNKVIIRIPAQYGLEFLFMEIGRKLKERIYVDNDQFDKYIFFPAMDECISTNAEQCRIYFAQLSQKIIRSHIHQIIHSSAMYWKRWNRNKPIFAEVAPNQFRVAYSSHSSYSELKDFIELVKPKTIKLNVISPGAERDMQNCLDEILNGLHGAKKSVQQNPKFRFNNIFRIPGNSGAITRSGTPAKLQVKRVKL